MPSTVVLALRPPIARDEIRGLCERAAELLRGTAARTIVCDVGAIAVPDAVVVDALARLQLTAVRHGAEIRVRHAARDLSDLLELTGLCQILKECDGSGVESRREPE